MRESERVVALLPMKARSGRVPNKNFRPLNGKPLFAWVLDTLLALEEIEQVVINTDAAALLREHGVDGMRRVLIRDRKPELCGDLISMNRILADDIQAVAADVYLMTHTTNPFLSPGTIRRALERFRQAKSAGEGDSLFTVNRIQTRFYHEDGSPINHDPDDLVRTQDLEPWYEENSNLYVFTGESFQKTNARIGARPVMLQTPKLESLDIDDQDDWTLAEALARYRSPEG